MKKLMIVGKQTVEQEELLSPGLMVEVYCDNLSIKEKLSRFSVQSVSKSDIAGVFIVILTKGKETLLLKWDTKSGYVDLNYLTSHVNKRNFSRMVVTKGLLKTLDVSPSMTFKNQVEVDIKQPAAKGVEFRSSNAKFKIEHICEDGSVVLQSTKYSTTDKDKVYPTKTIIVGPANHDFWRASSLDAVWEQV